MQENKTVEERKKIEKVCPYCQKPLTLLFRKNMGYVILCEEEACVANYGLYGWYTETIETAFSFFLEKAKESYLRANEGRSEKIKTEREHSFFHILNDKQFWQEYSKEFLERLKQPEKPQADSVCTLDCNKCRNRTFHFKSTTQIPTRTFYTCSICGAITEKAEQDAIEAKEKRSLKEFTEKLDMLLTYSTIRKEEPMKTEIFIKTTFAAYHKWPEAPEEVSFLQNKHRHLFHVEIYFTVAHDDREKEFFILKKKVNEMLTLSWSERDLGARSCEMMAKELLTFFSSQGACKAVVSEDGENGAIVYKN